MCHRCVCFATNYQFSQSRTHLRLGSSGSARRAKLPECQLIIQCRYPIRARIRCAKSRGRNGAATWIENGTKRERNDRTPAAFGNAEFFIDPFKPDCSRSEVCFFCEAHFHTDATSNICLLGDVSPHCHILYLKSRNNNTPPRSRSLFT